ncbi:hypothetical protein M6B38_354855 [Iris pallida]|uniref:Uncharacterized protein n=1 Tax=Iris pallida TaxID=29817 RepID=A0AAX6GNF1_IRIPA|nr:hypothetical protein M6B38_354855 [Iris pallida]
MLRRSGCRALPAISSGSSVDPPSISQQSDELHLHHHSFLLLPRLLSVTPTEHPTTHHHHHHTKWKPYLT